MRDHAQLGILLLAPVARPGCQADRLLLDEADGSHAIPLHLEQPFIAARRLLGQLRFHGRYGFGHGRFNRALQRSEVKGRFFGARRRGGLGGSGRACGTRWPAAGPHSLRIPGGGLPGLAGRQSLSDLLLCTAGEHAPGVLLDVPSGHCRGIPFLDQQPLVALAAILHVHQREFALELFAMQAELEVAARQLLSNGRVAQQVPGDIQKLVKDYYKEKGWDIR